MYFPLVSIPIRHVQYSFGDSGLSEDFKGWKKVESKKCTIALLTISFILGLGLVGLGCVGSFSSVLPFHLPKGIYITSIVIGAALTIPAGIAIKLGFKPTEEAKKTPVEISPILVHAFQLGDPVEAKSESQHNPDIEKEKEAFERRIPNHYFSKVVLSDKTVYYFGRKEELLTLKSNQRKFKYHMPDLSRDSEMMEFMRKEGLTFLTYFSS